jgi:hypothetical protein
MYTVYNPLRHALIHLRVFASPLVMAPNGGPALSSGFPNCPCSSATAITNKMLLDLLPSITQLPALPICSQLWTD